MSKKYKTIKRKHLAEAFTEWERRYREEPEQFQDTVTRLLRETPYSYGQACAVYFRDLLEEVVGR